MKKRIAILSAVASASLLTLGTVFIPIYRGSLFSYGTTEPYRINFTENKNAIKEYTNKNQIVYTEKGNPVTMNFQECQTSKGNCLFMYGNGSIHNVTPIKGIEGFTIELANPDDSFDFWYGDHPNPQHYNKVTFNKDKLTYGTGSNWRFNYFRLAPTGGRAQHLKAIHINYQCVSYNQWVTVDIEKDETGAPLGGVSNLQRFGEYQVGQTCTLKADEQYDTRFVGWYTKDGTLVSTNPVYSFVVQEDVDVHLDAKFEKIPELTVSFGRYPQTLIPIVSDEVKALAGDPVGPDKNGYKRLMVDYYHRPIGYRNGKYDHIYYKDLILNGDKFPTYRVICVEEDQSAIEGGIEYRKEYFRFDPIVWYKGRNSRNEMMSKYVIECFQQFYASPDGKPRENKDPVYTVDNNDYAHSHLIIFLIVNFGPTAFTNSEMGSNFVYKDVYSKYPGDPNPYRSTEFHVPNLEYLEQDFMNDTIRTGYLTDYSSYILNNFINYNNNKPVAYHLSDPGTMEPEKQDANATCTEDGTLDKLGKPCSWNSLGIRIMVYGKDGILAGKPKYY